MRTGTYIGSSVDNIPMSTRRRTFLLVAGLSVLESIPAFAQTHHRLLPTPKTVVWGYYDAAVKPVLRVRSGDTVEIRSAMIASPEMLERAGLPPGEIDAGMRELHRAVTDRGPG